MEAPLKVRDLVDRFELEPAAGVKGLDREVKGGYCGDLLSDVMANAGPGALWLTIQSHKNIVGVAVLSELAGIILVNGRRPDEDTAAKADEEGIPVLLTPRPAFETAGLLCGAGGVGTGE
jgi:predicted transcriptional regulator